MKKTLLLLAVVGSFAACKKSESTLSDTEKKVTGKWRMTSNRIFFVLNGKVTSEVDGLTYLDTCQRDDLVDFRADHSIYTDAGALKCFPMQPQQTRGATWKLADNDRSLVMTTDSAALSMKWSIVEVTAARMRLYKDSTASANGVELSAKTLVTYER